MTERIAGIEMTHKVTERENASRVSWEELSTFCLGFIFQCHH